MEKERIIESIKEGKTALGIEFGSTRIKAVLVDETHHPIASGGYAWENQLNNGIWSYSQKDIWEGLAACYEELRKDVQEKYQISLNTIGCIGISAMMHGYMPFDHKGELLVPFRTWRNNITEQAADELTDQFAFNIPQRWSIAHLYQAILNQEKHVENIEYLTTLAGYVHWRLTGEKVLGIGDASGMFPIDSETCDYRRDLVERFDALIKDRNYKWKLKDILPVVKLAGDYAGTLSEQGAALLDRSGTLKAGIRFCPPESDAGTGMTATNTVKERSGNVSAGTSVFAMIVLEKALQSVHREIDMVTTPSGKPVAMAHSQNCTSDINAWASVFSEFAEAAGFHMSMEEIYPLLFRKALEGDRDCGGLLGYGYFSGEHMTGFEEGRPLFVRKPDSRFTLANFMRTQLSTALGALKCGMDILFKEEGVQVDQILGHGGFFKTEGVGQRIMAAAVNTPVSVFTTAGEGGAWGIALLASYCMEKKEESLEEFLDQKVFCGVKAFVQEPDPQDVAGFEVFMKQYRKGLAIERAAVRCME